MQRLLILLISLFTFLPFSYSQKENTSKLLLNRKGAMFVFWGWNRAAYTNSNVHFQGADYDFTIHSMIARDRQSPVNFYNYLHPLRVTIPQTNFRAGFFILDNLAIVLGVDHMKYVMDQQQTARITGTIGNPYYAGMIHDGKIDLTNTRFLTYEHTDGLNYINLGVEKYLPIFGNRWFDMNWSYGAGFGFMLPKSNVRIFDNTRSDRFHLAGFGADARTNLNLIFWKHLQLRAEFKVGYINMPDIMTTLHNKPDKASQQFGFMQFNFGVGYFFQTITPNKTSKVKREKKAK